MSVLVAVEFVAVLSTGLLAGHFLGDRSGASFARPELPPSSFVKFQQVQHVHFLKILPALGGVAILSSIAWLILIRSQIGTVSFSLLALGTLLYISGVVITRTIHYPINEQLMTWSVDSPPPNVMEIWARWEQAHTVRTVLAIIGFACEVLALVATNGPVA